MTRLALVLLLLAPSASAQAAYNVTIPADGATGEALDALHRGLELLHSFEYDEARDAFRLAQALDSLNVMALWGEAMTHNHPVWQRQETDAGRAVLARLDVLTRRRLDRGRSMAADRERQDSYLRAVRLLFDEMEDVSKEDRDDAYLGAMARHAAAFPDDRDGRAFHALALLGSAHEGRDYDVYGLAAEVAQSVLDEDPVHPGALHYLIHAYDDPDHAALALPAARVYSEIVSAASHALHMPTHIYFALGLWDEASALNVRAFEAARDASARRGEPLNNHGWHALYWLNYSELQLGNDDRAMALLDTARARYAADPSVLSLTHLVRIRAQLAADVDLMQIPGVKASLSFTLPRETMSPLTEAIDLAAMNDLGIGPIDGLLRLQDLAAAEPATSPLQALALLYPLPIERESDSDDFAPAYFFGPEELQNHLDALAIVEASPITFGPPTPVVFPHEWLALAYFVDGQPEVVECLLDAVERRAPNRRMTNRLRESLPELRQMLPSLPRREPVPVPMLCAAP